MVLRGERLFRLQFARDSTADEPAPTNSETLPSNDGASGQAPSKATIAEHLLTSSEFQRSGEEAHFEMITSATFVGWLQRLIYRLAFRLVFRNWRVFLNAIPLGGYDPRNMLTEWRERWRRKGV